MRGSKCPEGSLVGGVKPRAGVKKACYRGPTKAYGAVCEAIQLQVGLACSTCGVSSPCCPMIATTRFLPQSTCWLMQPEGEAEGEAEGEGGFGR